MMWRTVVSINRNIVECKSFPAVCTLLSCTVLIETLWNVNHVGYHMDYREEQY